MGALSQRRFAQRSTYLESGMDATVCAAGDRRITSYRRIKYHTRRRVVTGVFKMAINTADSKVQTTAAARNPYITSSVTSKDGTTISYCQIGYGPAVVL